jgi:hypothetical protein
MTIAVQQATEPSNKAAARRLWIWPIAILISFPIGGYLADLVVNGVDSIGAALAGGLIAGLVIGAAEWFALRRWVSWLWIAATSIGMAAGLTAGAALVGYGTSRGGHPDHGCGHRARCRSVAGSGALKIASFRRPLVGDREPASMGTWLVRDLVRDHEEHSGPVHQLRR